MRHLNAHRKLGRTSEHRMSMLRNMATSLINARDERIITTVPKAKELRPFVERVITLAKRASGTRAPIKNQKSQIKNPLFFLVIRVLAQVDVAAAGAGDGVALLVEGHAEVQPHAVQYLLDLV